MKEATATIKKIRKHGLRVLGWASVGEACGDPLRSSTRFWRWLLAR